MSLDRAHHLHKIFRTFVFGSLSAWASFDNKTAFVAPLNFPLLLTGYSKYFLLKYEDFTVLPKLVTAYIYSFFGLGEVPSNVEEWIDENTKLPSCESRNVSAVDCNKGASAGNPYSTRRNSANMANLWRSQVPEERSNAVWDACQASGVMNDLGYEL